MMKIVQSIRLAQNLQNPPPLISPLSFRGGRTVRFIQSQPKNDSDQEMGDNKAMAWNHSDKTGFGFRNSDVMSHSFGEGYATRSDEEGFGGIYGDNSNNEAHKFINESHPDYDRKQGSEVSEIEKGRNQKKVDY